MISGETLDMLNYTICKKMKDERFCKSTLIYLLTHLLIHLPYSLTDLLGDYKLFSLVISSSCHLYSRHRIIFIVITWFLAEDLLLILVCGIVCNSM